MVVPIIISFALCLYLIGSIPFGLLLTKLAGYGDIRQIGSGNIGATNVLRTGNKLLALLTLLLDAGKGATGMLLIPVIMDLSIIPFGKGLDGNDETTLLLTTFAAPTLIIMGHMFPVWLKFRGGKGVATMFGILFAVNWQIGMLAAACWLGVFALSRISSLAALLGFPITLITSLMLWPDEAGYVYVLAVPVLLIIAKHHENIRRLLKGEEHRFSFGGKK